MTDAEVEAVARNTIEALLGGIKVRIVDTLPSDAWMLVSQRADGSIEVACAGDHVVIAALDQARKP